MRTKYSSEITNCKLHLNNMHAYKKAYINSLSDEIKLKIIDRWLKNINYSDIKPNSSLDILYKGLADTCHQMSNLICIINTKIKYHNNLWFSTWRSINLDNEMKKMGRLTRILSDRIVLINIIENKNTIETPDSKDLVEIIKEPGDTMKGDFTIL